jgi:hypothetical protein
MVRTGQSEVSGRGPLTLANSEREAGVHPTFTSFAANAISIVANKNDKCNDTS